jgi:hypothetical protein
VNGAHEALDDTKLIVDDFGDGGKTVGSARCIGDLANKYDKIEDRVDKI